MKIRMQLVQDKALAPKAWAPSAWLAQLSSRQVLFAIMLVATLLRIGSALYQGNLVTNLPGIYDQISYDRLAQRVIAGHGFSFAQDHWPATRAGQPTAHWSYLYTLYLAALYLFFGVQPVVARLLQAVIAGVLHSWLAWRLGRRIFGQTVGLLAAALSAIYIYFFYYAGALITETFYILGILWTFDCALRLAALGQKPVTTPAASTSHWRLWGELGVAIGVTVLLRQLFLLFVPFLFGWLWWNGSTSKVAIVSGLQLPAGIERRLGRGLLCTALIISLLIAPWTIRNYRAFGTFVPLNTNAGYAFFWGNHPIYGTRFVGILPADGPSYYDLLPAELLHLNEAALDRALLQRGMHFVITDPLRYLWLSLSRSVEYFKFWPAATSGLISNVARVGSFGLALPLMLYGLGLTAVRWRQPQLRQAHAALVLLYLFMLVYTGIHLLSWALIRYRLPVDAVLLLFAAAALAHLGQRLRMKE